MRAPRAGARRRPSRSLSPSPRSCAHFVSLPFHENRLAVRVITHCRASLSREWTRVWWCSIDGHTGGGTNWRRRKRGRQVLHGAASNCASSKPSEEPQRACQQCRSMAGRLWSRPTPPRPRALARSRPSAYCSSAQACRRLRGASAAAALGASADPLAVAAAAPPQPPCSDITFTVRDRATKAPKQILKGISGRVGAPPLPLPLRPPSSRCRAHASLAAQPATRCRRLRRRRRAMPPAPPTRQVEPNELTVIMGSSGAGKTTLVRWSGGLGLVACHFGWGS